MSDKELAAGLEEVASWIDSLYERLRGAEIMFATELGNEAYCESLMADIERVVELGVAMDRPMEHCACLFEALVEFRNPADYLLKARAEINNLAVVIRQQATEAHRSSAEKNKSRKQPDRDVTKFVRKNWHKYEYNKRKAVRAFMEIENISASLFDSYYGQLTHDCRKKPLVKPKK